MDLLIMAAGKGSRFGGPKQLEPVGPADCEEMFIGDFSNFDAVSAGVNRIVIITREELVDKFKSSMGDRLKKAGIPVEFVIQNINDVPKGTVIPKDRTKPWGTAHAIYSARHVLTDDFAKKTGGKFIVINADDFYGKESFKIAVDFMKNSLDDEFVNVGFYVKNTLSDKGAVKRGIIDIENGCATGLVESEIERRDDGKIWATPLGSDDWKVINEDTLVSMNMFGFNLKLVEKLNRELARFFKDEDLTKAESLIPSVVSEMVQDGEVKLKVIETPSKWYGVTYREELGEFKDVIANKIESGEYPRNMYQSLKIMNK